MKKKRRFKTNKDNRLYTLFLDSKEFVKSLKIYLWIIIGLLAFSILMGILMPCLFEKEVLKLISQIMKKTSGLNSLELIKYIFMNNLQSSFVGLIAGVFFGVFPILSSIVNGYVIGFVINKTIAVSGVLIIWRLLPHGIFEIPAVVISLAMGLKLGTFIFFYHRKFWKELWQVFKKCLLAFIFIVIPLLIIAGIIEGLLIYLVG